MEVAHPQSGSSSTWFLVEWEFGNVGFWGEGKPEYPEKNLSEQRREPTMALFVSLCFYELPLYQILDLRCLPAKYLMEDWVILWLFLANTKFNNLTKKRQNKMKNPNNNWSSSLNNVQLLYIVKRTLSSGITYYIIFLTTLKTVVSDLPTL